MDSVIFKVIFNLIFDIYTVMKKKGHPFELSFKYQGIIKKIIWLLAGLKMR